MVKVILKFFARYREIAGKSELEFNTNGSTLKEVILEISHFFPQIPWNEALISLNHKHTTGNEIVRDGDIISVYPPVSGG